MGYVFSAPPQAAVSVAGTADLFPVRRIYCVGRNYVDHAIEMGHSGREAPFFFAKPADALIPVAEDTEEMPYPPETTNLHHEIELVAAIGKAGRRIAADQARQHVWGYAVGLDMTRRDLQGEAKKLGRPWEVGKGFDFSAPISRIVPAAQTGEIKSGRIWLTVNGHTRQDSDISKLIWDVNQTIAHLSRFFHLMPGDLIFTGTPEGVDKVQPGDILDGGVDGVGTLRIKIAPRSDESGA